MGHFLELEPTANQSFRLIGHGSRGNLTARLEQSYKVAQSGDYEGACQLRYEAFEDILSTLPDDEQSIVTLDRNHPNTLAAMEIMLASAVDNYLAGEAEMAAAQVELLIDSDDEDPLEATPLLALCYAMLGEWECLEDIDTDIGEKTALRPLMRALRGYVATKGIDGTICAEFARFKEFTTELKADDHTPNDAYLRDITSEHPSRTALAKELYLRCEPLFEAYPDFIAALKAKL